jgi:hypothetical protein
MLDQIAIYLLGLEPACYATAQGKERSYIHFVLFSFTLVLLSSLMAMFVLGLFVSGSYWLAVPIALLGTFVFISIFRFSLILIKPEIKLLTRLNEVVLQTSTKEKWQRTMDWIKNSWKELKTIRWNTNVAIPGFTVVFRFLYMGLLAFVLVFPLTTLFHWSATMEYNDTLRDKALQNYREGVSTSGNNNGYAAMQKLSYYEEKVNAEYFTMQLFQHASAFPEFRMVAFLVCALLFLPHALLFMMMRNKEFSYVANLNVHFRALIEANYAQLEAEAKRELAKFKAYSPTHDLSFLYKGNPYLEEPTQSKRENISWKELQKRMATTNANTSPTVQV